MADKTKREFPTKPIACSICSIVSHYEIVTVRSIQYRYHARCGHYCPVQVTNNANHR